MRSGVVNFLFIEGSWGNKNWNESLIRKQYFN